MRTITVQFYSDDQLVRAFYGEVMMFEIAKATFRELDAFGIPRIGKKNGWLKTPWGWEIKADIKFRKHKKSEL